MHREGPALSASPTGGVATFDVVHIPHTQSVVTRLAKASELHRQVQQLGPVTTELRREELTRRWQEVAHALLRKSPQELLDEIADQGIAWRDVAKIIGVSVPAIQKWRRGQGLTGENRWRVAQVAALLQVLCDFQISAPASWLEVPLMGEYSPSALDMLAAGRYELVLELADDEYSSTSSVEVTLDEFDPNWRESQRDDGFEVVMSSDGLPSIRMKG